MLDYFYVFNSLFTQDRQLPRLDYLHPCVCPAYVYVPNEYGSGKPATGGTTSMQIWQKDKKNTEVVRKSRAGKDLTK